MRHSRVPRPPGLGNMYRPFPSHSCLHCTNKSIFPAASSAAVALFVVVFIVFLFSVLLNRLSKQILTRATMSYSLYPAQRDLCEFSVSNM